MLNPYYHIIISLVIIIGCVVYEWEPQSRTILSKLDCSKLAPCSESIKSISIEEHLSPGRCQVCDNDLFLKFIKISEYSPTLYMLICQTEGGSLSRLI